MSDIAREIILPNIMQANSLKMQLENLPRNGTLSVRIEGEEFLSFRQDLQIFLRPEYSGPWLWVGPAEGMQAQDLQVVVEDFEADDRVSIKIEGLSPAELEALPEFAGW